MVVDILLLIALALFCAAALVLTVLQLPGTWLLVVASCGYAWFGDGQPLSWRTVGLLVAIALVAELVEFFSGMWMGRRGGASRRGAWFGLLGGIIGALMLTLPIPLFGTIGGAIVGCFLGAFVGEITGGRALGEGARSGTFTALGRAVGSMFKVAAVLAMSAIVLFLSISTLVASAT